MLSSLLPGLREVRAPLAAGFVWITALWFMLAPRWVGDSGADGVVDLAYRLMSTLSILGQGVVMSFAAYLLGSFSVFLFSRPLLSLFRTSMEADPGPLSGLSELGRVSLTKVSADGRQKLEGALALSGVGVDEVLGLTARVPDTTDKRARTGRRGRRRRLEPTLLSSTTVLSTPEELQETEIAERVLRDLPVVANAQLLGREPEVYSAVDRSQAEVEFRVALMPALLALSVSLAVAAAPESVILTVTVGLVGVLGAAGLILDAARQRRDSNELILSLMEHRRITPPALLRAESTAATLADQAPAKVVGRQAEETARAIRQYLASLEAVPSSGSLPMLTQAHDASARAHEEALRLDRLLAHYSPALEPDAKSAQEVLEPLDRALAGWTALNAGLSVQSKVPEVKWQAGAPAPDELVRLIVEGRERNRAMIGWVRTAVTDIATKDSARAAVPRLLESDATTI